MIITLLEVIEDILCPYLC